MPSNRIDIRATAERLAAAGGGYEIVHDSPGLEVGVYVLVAPAPDDQQPHEWDELYVVWDGAGVLTIDGDDLALEQGGAAFVAAGVEHRFGGYERLSLLVVFDKTRG